MYTIRIFTGCFVPRPSTEEHHLMNGVNTQKFTYIQEQGRIFTLRQLIFRIISFRAPPSSPQVCTSLRGSRLSEVGDVELQMNF